MFLCDIVKPFDQDLLMHNTTQELMEHRATFASVLVEIDISCSVFLDILIDDAPKG